MTIDPRWKNPHLYMYKELVTAFLFRGNLYIDNVKSTMTLDYFEDHYRGPDITQIPQIYKRTYLVWCVHAGDIVLCCKTRKPKTEFDIYYRTPESFSLFTLNKVI